MKIFLALILLVFIVGCSAHPKDITSEFKLPPELKDYRVIQLHRDGGAMALYVLVKSNENREVIGTSTSEESSVHTVVIDDKEYIEKGIVDK